MWMGLKANGFSAVGKDNVVDGPVGILNEGFADAAEEGELFATGEPCEFMGAAGAEAEGNGGGAGLGVDLEAISSQIQVVAGHFH